MTVFVSHFFQFRQFIKSTGFRHGGGQVADKAGAAAAFGDDAFAGNRHQVRVNVGQGTQSDIRIAGVVQPGCLARQPFQIAVGAQMDHCVCFEYFPQPVIESQVLMGGGYGRIMIGPGGIHAILAGGLHSHKNIAVHGTGHQNIAFVGQHDIAGSFAPLFRHLLPRFFRQGGKESRVFIRGKFLAFFCLLVG